MRSDTASPGWPESWGVGMCGPYPTGDSVGASRERRRGVTATHRPGGLAVLRARQDLHRRRVGAVARAPGRSTSSTPPTARSSAASRPAPPPTSTPPPRPPRRVRRLGRHLQGGAGQVLQPHRRGPRRPHGRDRHHRHPRGGHAEVAEPARAGRPADQLLRHRRRAGRELRVRDDGRHQPRRAGAGRRRRVPSPRGTTRSTRSPPRSPTPWPPAAPSCSSRARSPRSTPTSSPRSSTTSACPPACSTWSPAPAPRSGRPSPSTPTIDMVSFTGSTRAGKAVAAAASGTLKRVALELGGKSANILLDDLDDAGFEKAVRDGVGKAYLNSGQTCTALTRMLVPDGPPGRRRAHRGRRGRDRTTSRATRSPTAPASARSRARPRSTGSTATSRRASTRAPSSSPAAPASPRASSSGYYVKPTVFSEVTQRHDHRPGGDLRPGPVDPPLRRRGRRRAPSPTTRPTACPAACGRPTRSGPRASPAGSAPARSRSTAGPSTPTPPSAATSSPATAASTASTASRSSSRPRPCSSVAERRARGSDPAHLTGSVATPYRSWYGVARARQLVGVEAGVGPAVAGAAARRRRRGGRPGRCASGPRRRR